MNSSILLYLVLHMDGSVFLCLVVDDEAVYDVGILIARSHTANIVCSTDVDGSAL